MQKFTYYIKKRCFYTGIVQIVVELYFEHNTFLP